MQQKQHEWKDQWSRWGDDTPFLFKDWIHPFQLTDFKGKRVLEAGCGHGEHSLLVAEHAKELVGVDLNAHEIALEKTKDKKNISIVEGDIAKIKFDEPFDVVFCVGVIHHTDSPDATFEHLKNLTKKGGRMIIWCYSREGNFLNRTLVEGIKTVFLKFTPRWFILFLSHLLTIALYPIVHTIYRIPLAKILPFYEYFGNFRKLSYHRNMVNVFDKLNAPYTEFISRERAERWFNSSEFDEVHISPYVGVSWRCSGRKK